MGQSLADGWEFVIRLMWITIAGSFVYTSSVLWYAVNTSREVAALEAAVKREAPRIEEQKDDQLQIAELKRLLADLNVKVDKIPASEERLKKVESVLKAYIK